MLLLIWLLVAPFLFQSVDLHRPALWIALYSAVHKHLWGVQLMIVIVGFTSGYGGRLKKFLNWPGWWLAGKLNYGVFLIHISTFKILIRPYIDHLQLTYGLEFYLFTLVVAVSYIISIVLHLMIELPVQNLEQLHSCSRKNISDGDDNNKKDE